MLIEIPGVLVWDEFNYTTDALSRAEFKPLPRAGPTSPAPTSCSTSITSSCACGRIPDTKSH